jgi:hypothetical protein
VAGAAFHEHHRSMSPGSTRAAPADQAPGRLAALLDEAGRILLVGLALVLPFELPVCHLGPLQLTTVEIVLYATLAVWSLSAARRPRESVQSAIAAVRSDPWVQMTLAWIAVMFASAFAAPSYQGPAFKFALRSLSGVMIFFAVRAMARHRPTWQRVVWALVAGALVSAATAWIDSWFPGSEVVWAAFRESSFSTFGLRRASGVFAYPTIGAMYWEAAVPLVVSAPLLNPFAEARGGRRAIAFTAAASALLVGAILASATRSGIAGVLVAVVTLLAFGGPAGPWLWRSAAWAGAVLAVSWLLAMDTTQLLGQRLQWWRDDSWLRAQYELESPMPPSLMTREMFEMRLRIRNTGTVAWKSNADQPTRLAYHWQPVRGKASYDDYEGLRTDLPVDVEPGTTFEMWGRAEAPNKVGSYVLRWDLVREGVSWFSECGNATADVAVDVRQGVRTAAAASPSQPLQIASPLPPPRPALWRAARVLWRERPLLGVGPDNFRRRYQAILSPAPNGQPYRDTRIHANNWYFETLADLGLAGIAALGWMAFVLFRSIRRHFAEGNVAGIGVGLAAALFFVHGALDYFLEFTPLYGLFWLLLGLTSAAPQERALPVPSAGGPPGSTP